MELINIFNCLEHNTFIGKKKRLDNKNMYIISYKNPLPSLRLCYKGIKMLSILKDINTIFTNNMYSLPCYAIYSYYTLVAYIIYDENKNVVLLRTKQKYSRTTSKHLTQLENMFRSYFNTYFMRYETDRISYKNKFESYVLDFSIFDN